MNAFLAIVLCILSVFGLYALLSRLAVFLLPKGCFFLTLSGDRYTVEELLALASRARLLYEREGRLAQNIAVLLEKEDPQKENTLRKEGLLVYIIKN